MRCIPSQSLLIRIDFELLGVTFIKVFVLQRQASRLRVRNYQVNAFKLRKSKRDNFGTSRTDNNISGSYLRFDVYPAKVCEANSF